MQYFCERLSLSDLEFQRVIKNFSFLLNYRPSRIETGIIFFGSFGFNHAKIQKILFQSPSIMYFTGFNLLRKVYLVRKKLAMSIEELITLMLRNSNWLSCSIYQTERLIRFLFNFGMTIKEVHICVLRHPQLLTYNIKSLLKRLKVFIFFGFTNDEIVEIVKRTVQVLSLEVGHNLNPTLNYLINEIKIAHDKIASTPSVISLSLSERIIPRYQMFFNVAPFDIDFKLKYMLLKNEEFESILNKKEWNSTSPIAEQLRKKSYPYNSHQTKTLQNLHFNESINEVIRSNRIRHLKTMW